MSALLKVVAGPELFWITAYVVTRAVGARNVPATAAGNLALERLTWFLAIGAVALSFAFLLVPGVNRWVMLARIGIAGFIGLNACAIMACERINYPELGRNSGLMALWMMAVMLGGVVYVVGAIASALVWRWTAPG